MLDDFSPMILIIPLQTITIENQGTSKLSRIRNNGPAIWLEILTIWMCGLYVILSLPVAKPI